MSHNHQKKIAVINDMSGFGRCSLTVSLPIISYLGIQCCPLPTSILSNHMGYGEYFFDDYTDRMEEYISKWRRLGLKFEGITSGFLGSVAQIEMVIRFIEEFRSGRTQVIIDPVMGENGKAYPTYTEEMCDKMKHLVEYADILTPNVTEACMLTGMPFKDKNWQRKELLEMMARLRELGAKKIVVSGLDSGQFISNAVSENHGECKLIRQKRVGKVRSGTGDIFSSIIAADCVNGVDFETSVRKAAAFVQECIRVTERFDIPETDGVCFEEVLHKLR